MLSALEVLLTERSVSRAARRMGLSQPAMSNALARMRIAFDDPLMERSREGLVLTPRAESLLAQLKVLVPQLDLLGRPDGFAPSEATTVFHIAITDHASLLLMPDVLEQVHQEAPRVRLITSTLRSRQSEGDELEAGGFDLRVGWMKTLPPHWRSRKLMDERLVVIGRRSNPALQGPLTLERFLELDHLALAADRPMFQNIVDSTLARQGLERRITASISHFTLLPFLIAKSSAIAMFPERLAQAFSRLTDIVVLEPPIAFDPFNISMAWHPRVQQDAAHRWLRRIFAQCAQSRHEAGQADAAGTPLV